MGYAQNPTNICGNLRYPQEIVGYYYHIAIMSVSIFINILLNRFSHGKRFRNTPDLPLGQGA